MPTDKKILSFSFLLLLLSSTGLVFSNCQCQQNLTTCAAGDCPCIISADCPEGFDCVEDRCVEHLDWPDAGEDGGPGLLGFGELCPSNDACESGYCVPDARGQFCSVRCQAACPDGWACRLVTDPRGEEESVGLCLYDRQSLCQDCVDDVQCNPAGGDLCLSFGDLKACGLDCSFSPCPDNYHCEELNLDDARTVHQCLPDSGTCACNSDSLDLYRSCSAENDLGICQGRELCAAGAWSSCSAPEPETEQCNGLDDDCNGQTDENLPDRPCSVSVEDWTCTGNETCAGSNGWLCDAATPRAEECDGLDNNCDGQVDEDFVDDSGRYMTAQHCGSCDVDCDELVPFATATDCRLINDQAQCGATACEAGYFVYTNDAGASLCMALPDELCVPCGNDDDCLAPGSRCLHSDDGDFCGRDCTADSIYGADCPVGYSCIEDARGSQCQPNSGSCLCNLNRQGAVRSCLVDQCTGYQVCAPEAGDWAWSSCDISAIQEICDGLDNNCNGAIDEGFIDAATGRYSTAEHCGFCNNDCTKLWTAELQHAAGTCDASSAFPVCSMSCVGERVDNVDYDWVDVDHDSNNGCECRRVQGNTAQDLPDRGAFPAAWANYIDENCDGVDGVIDDALFVSAIAAANGDGSLQSPYQSISAALNALAASGKSYILVAQGVYHENINLTEGAQIFGGYASDFMSRDILLHVSAIQGETDTNSNLVAAINASDIGLGASQTVVSGFHILGRNLSDDTAQGQNGESSIAVYLHNCGPALILQDNVIRGGQAAPGGLGETGASGFGRQQSADLDGRGGLPQVREFGNCPAGLWRPGGQAGHNSQCAQNPGHPGGGVTCPVFNWNASPYQGNQAQYSSPSGIDGAGGFDWSFDELSGPECGHVTESAWPNPERNIGGDGLDGDDGVSGRGGQGCQSPYGSIVNSLWVPGREGISAGSAGGIGAAGGGGGASGGTALWFSGGDSCDSHEQGATGGGGGAGACGGAGGQAGGQGGSSIAILISAAQSNATTASIIDNRIERGLGGDGGGGGFGGPGGQGGRGGLGGDATTWVGSTGGKGGDGGGGGSGGGGGGGCGGPSYAILAFSVSAPDWAQSNSFVLADSIVTSGLAGRGGGAASSEATGRDGLDGASMNILVLEPCGAGSACRSGQHCDNNNVCIPD